jgi:zinc protease
VAQSVSAYQSSAVLGSTFRVTVTARPGVPLATLEEEVRAAIEAMSRSIEAVEAERARNAVETQFIDALQNVGGFGGRADQLNLYLFHTGSPDYMQADLDRYAALTPDAVASAVRAYLLQPPAVLAVVPYGQQQLAEAAE